MSKTAKIGLVIYPEMTPLDIMGPHAVLCWAGEAQFVAETMDPVTTERGPLISPHLTFDEAPQFDVLVVPGGPGQDPQMNNQAMISFLQQQANGAQWVTSVCTGALLLAKAGLLNGLPAVTHWMAMGELGRLGAIPTEERVVVGRKDGTLPNIMTGAGVSAGIDMALALAAELVGIDRSRLIQLGIEYDPQPPFGGVTTNDIDPAMIKAMRDNYRYEP